MKTRISQNEFHTPAVSVKPILETVNARKTLRKLTQTYNKENNTRYNKTQVITNPSIPTIDVNLGRDVDMKALLDTGATHNIISKQLYDVLHKGEQFKKINLGEEKC